MSGVRRILTLLALLAALAAVVAGMRALRVQSMDHYLATQTYEDIYYVPPDPWLPVLSLGYDEALADLLWMRALIYFGEELAHRENVEHVYDYGNAMLTLDPDFRAVYPWVATAALYRTGKVTVEDARKAVEFLERGVRQFPDDGEMAWELGATMAYELAPHVEDKAEKKRLKREATEHFVVAARKGAGPPWLALSNSTKLQKLGRLEQAARHLEEMYAMVDNPSVKKQIARKLKRIRSEAEAEAFEQAQQRFEQRRKEDYPWISPGLYMLVGPRGVVDGAELLEQRFLPETSVSRDVQAGRKDEGPDDTERDDTDSTAP